MIEQMLGSYDFQTLMRKHAGEMVELLLGKGIHFSLLTNIAEVSFSPILPEDISKGLKPITMFYLAGYTFESAQIYDGVLSFEAGFGSDNFGSIVSIPLDTILQIIVEEVPIFINLAHPVKREKTLPKEEGVRRSMDALMANPKNKGLLKN